VVFEPPCRFTHLLKLPWLPRFPFAVSLRSVFSRDEVDLRQFETIFMFQ